MTGIVYTKIGKHRGGDRFWLEGRKLERAGIEPGLRFDIQWEPDEGRVVLTFGEEGERVVSKRTRNGKDQPIVSIASKDLSEVFGPGLDRAKVRLERRRMVVQVHPDDVATRERFDALMERTRNGEPLRTGSIAHGGGILDHALHAGLERQGFSSKLAFAIEIDPATLDTAVANNPIWDDETLLVEGGMQEVDPADLPKVDMLVAGLPCVGASRAGKAKNGIATAEEHPTAGMLFLPFLDIVKRTNPALVVLENVVDYGREISATIIRTKLREMGYDIYETVLAGNVFGALDDRRRLCLIAATKDLQLDMSKLLPVREKEEELGMVLDYVDLESEAWKDVSYLLDKEVRDRENGKNFSMNFVSSSDEKIRTMGAGYWKWRSAEPLIPHPTKPGHARLLTPMEHAAVKTIPYALVEGISNTMAHTIMGNAVIHAAFEAVGAFIGAEIRQSAQDYAISSRATLVLSDLVGEASAEALVSSAEIPEGQSYDLSEIVAYTRQGAFDFDDGVEVEVVKVPLPQM